MFNSKGNNKGLIRDRTVKGTRCLVSYLSECYEVTRGCKAIKSLLLLYKTVYLPTVIFNSEAWDNLTKSDITRLQVLQMKFLKRILQTPKSTPNCLVLLELGVLPIEYEIKNRQLNFLHHIVTLDEQDPVLRCYTEQKKYPFENNWAKDIKETFSHLGLQHSEGEIANMTKDQWKRIVKKKLNETALEDLHNQKSRLKKGSIINRYQELSTKKYFEELNASDARTFFKIRAEVYDIKTFRKYQYDDDVCRLCGNGSEDLDHIINRCKEIPRHGSHQIEEGSEDIDNVKIIIRRVNYFQDMVDRM